MTCSSDVSAMANPRVTLEEPAVSNRLNDTLPFTALVARACLGWCSAQHSGAEPCVFGSECRPRNARIRVDGAVRPLSLRRGRHYVIKFGTAMGQSRDVLKELFFAALERPAPEREAFLAKTNINGELLREVRALLVSHEQAGSFLEGGSRWGQAQEALRAGQSLGPYEVVELIGKGGMGEV